MTHLVSLAAAAVLSAVLGTGTVSAQTVGPVARPAPAQALQAPVQAPVQAPAAPTGPQGQPATDTPLLTGATVAQDCGGLYGLAGKAHCVSAPLTSVGDLAEAYINDFKAKGWLVADGDENRIIFVKRRPAGGCDGLQMQAFYDQSRPTAPDSLGFLGFATIPGNICASDPSAVNAGAAPPSATGAGATGK